MRRSLALFIALSLILSACGTLEISLETPPAAIADMPANAPPQATVEPGLSLNSTSEQIQRALLTSARNWKSLWMDGTVTYFAMEGTDSQTVTTHEQVWIDLTTNRFRVLSGPSNGAAERFRVSDGMSILQMDLKTGQSEIQPMPELAKGPFVPTLEPGYASPQPLWGQIGTPVAQLAFSSDFAQSEGLFKPVALEFVAGREALAVEWNYIQNELPSWRLWLDTRTAVILKMQTFEKEGGEALRTEVLVNEIRYDHIFADSLFRAPSVLPDFSDITGRPLTAPQPAPTLASGSDPLGQVYFFASDHVYGAETVQLVRVPGSCAAGLEPCPQPEVIVTPFELKFSLTSLVWSPEGDAAAFAYPISADGNRAALFLFDPEEQTWQSLAEFNYMDPPSWSADGNWLAFRVQDGTGSDDIYAVRRDGSQLTNLSVSEQLPGDGRPYALSGWINNHAVLHSRGSGTVYVLRPDDGQVTTLFETPLAKSDLVIPSPDGYFLAYTDAAGENLSLRLLTPDGRIVRDLATFKDMSVYPVVWSPDATQLAFAATAASQDAIMEQHVYLVGSDGRGLKQVYRSQLGGIASLAFSPDGKYLLIQDDDAAGRHIFTIDLATATPHMLQVPNLPLDWWWLAPSWR